MVAISRRTFVEKLGLGLGATLLSPVAQTLVNEARGQASNRKIAFFWYTAEGLQLDLVFTPADFRPARLPSNKDKWVAVLDGPTKYAWPDCFKALEPYRDRALLLDGLANENKGAFNGGHSMKYGALSCMPPGNGKDPAADGTPGGITIDQFIANGMGGATARKSVLFGISSNNDPQYSSIFATAKDRPEPHFQSPAALFNDVFGSYLGAAAGMNDTGPSKTRILFDTLRADIGRMQRAFAAPERGKLDAYLKAMEEFEKREGAAGALTCAKPAAPAAAAKPAPEDALESMHNIATLALACGITNVAGVALGCGFSHGTFPTLRKLLVGTPVFGAPGENGPLKQIDGGIGHEPPAAQGPAMTLVFNWCSRMLAHTIDTLQKVQVGNTTLWDQSLMLLTSENAEAHHADHMRWPLLLVGNAGGKIKADGRYIRFPVKGTAGARSLADLYCSMATGLGVPTNTFGMGGNEPVKGPLETIMA
jgi:hypothetical protein